MGTEAEAKAGQEQGQNDRANNLEFVDDHADTTEDMGGG